MAYYKPETEWNRNKRNFFLKFRHYTLIQIRNFFLWHGYRHGHWYWLYVCLLFTNCLFANWIHLKLRLYDLSVDLMCASLNSSLLLWFVVFAFTAILNGCNIAVICTLHTSIFDALCQAFRHYSCATQYCFAKRDR